jgi:hypothetical protein
VSAEPFRMTILMVTKLGDGAHLMGGDCSGTLELGDSLIVLDGNHEVGRASVDAFNYGRLQRSPSLWLQMFPAPRPGEDGELGVAVRISGIDDADIAVGQTVVSDPPHPAWTPAQVRVPDTEIEFLGHTTPLRFDDGSYRWVDHKRFRVDPAASNPDLLAALVTNPEYRDDYGRYNDRDAPVHGPYQLARIGLESFTEISPAQAVETFMQWLEDDEVALRERHIVGDVPCTTHLLRDASVCYRLQDLGSNAHHATGWILQLFLELVAIDRTNEELHLLVAAVD